MTAGLGYGFDSYAVNIYGLVLPEIKKTLHITEAQAGYIGSIFLLGYTIGTVGFGLAADRWGRKTTLGASILLYGTTTALAGLTTNIAAFTGLRFLTGVGGAGELAVGAPYAIVHNAGVNALGFVEETPDDAWAQVFSTNLFGPVVLTKALLPSMREAGRGRLVMVASQGGIWGMPSAAAYSAAQAGLERFAESLAAESAPFGLGVTVLVAGMFDTGIIDDRAPGYPDYRDWDGIYAKQHGPLDVRGHRALKLARTPDTFAKALAKTLDRDKAPFVRHGVGMDARMMMLSGRLMPSRALYQMGRLFLGQPRHGALVAER